jgi:hypothetical protein
MGTGFLRSAAATLPLWISAVPVVVRAQDTSPPAAQAQSKAGAEEVHDLRNLVRRLQEQVAKLSSAQPGGAPTPQPGETAATSPTSGGMPPTPTQSGGSAVSSASAATNFLKDVTINALVDGYYEYNFNSPVGRVNNLRAYDVSSNSFSLNQADLILESAVDVSADKRYGVRVDLQYGQATSTLQGNAANELRPEIYRNVFEAYGTYVFPVLDGLTVDFGKWASSLGIEGNYTKDQLNYSRSFWFDYLPFYHMGARAKLALNDELAINFWITNGTDQTEAFNNYKDQLYGVVWTPAASFSWTVNYYLGQEHPDVEYLQSIGPGQQSLPNQQGTYILPISNAPDGKLQIFDTYVTWQALKELILAAEADYVQERLYSYSSPERVQGGALYAGYQLTQTIALATRAEYLADIGGLFSGTTQYLKEATLTLDYRPVDGFLVRGEYRRDLSNQRYFLGHTLGELETAQPTLGLGLVWWFGGKQGPW